jgi:hypothetical protein
LACLYSRSGIRSAPIASVQASEVCGGCGWCGRAMFSCAFGFSIGICGLCLGLCYFFCRVALRRWRVGQVRGAVCSVRLLNGAASAFTVAPNHITCTVMCVLLDLPWPAARPACRGSSWPSLKGLSCCMPSPAPPPSVTKPSVLSPHRPS